MTAGNINKVLICDDDKSIQFFLGELLKKEALPFDIASDGKEALDCLKTQKYSLVLLDERMPGMNGLEVLGRIKALGLGMPVIMITAYGSKELALKAIEEGAYDFFTKPVDVDIVRTVIKRALEKYDLQMELGALREEVVEKTLGGEIIARSPAMQKTLELAKKVAGTDVTVLITGESGSGKELLAKAMHRLSDRREGPFVGVNCAAIPEGLLESELFGYEKGAFTGAFKSHTGKFERASGGTIFLDEIGDLSAGLQAKLLRVLQDKEVEHLGGTSPVRVDVRVISATNKDIPSLIEDGGFREDLYYRIRVFEIHVPPLRERKEDIPLLADHFLRIYSKEMGKPVRDLSAPAIKLLISYHWPGNVREMENLLQRAIIMEEGDKIGAETVSTLMEGALPPVPPLKSAKEEEEKRLIVEALTKTKWRRQSAADLLGISRKNLFLKMKRYGLM